MHSEIPNERKKVEFVNYLIIYYHKELSISESNIKLNNKNRVQSNLHRKTDHLIAKISEYG